MVPFNNSPHLSFQERNKKNIWTESIKYNSIFEKYFMLFYLYKNNYMKKHSIDYLIAAILSFISSIITLTIINAHSPFSMMLAFIVFMILVNISSILFYKSLKVEKKWLKFPFSFVNLICYIILWAISGIHILNFIQPIMRLI